MTSLSVIAELDPSGEHGVVEEVLIMFHDSLEPMLTMVEGFRAAASVSDIQFEAHKLQSAAGQVGAIRLAEACAAISKYCGDLDSSAPKLMSDDLETLIHRLVSETIRVQRRLRQLLRP